MPTDPILIYNQSCPSLETLVQDLKRKSAHKLGLSLMPVEARYAAGVWKRLFLITLKRMAKTQPSVARLTAVEALSVVGSSAGSTFLYPKTAAPRHLIGKLRTMNARSLRGNSSPRHGFHPEDLRRWKNEALRVFRETRPDKAIASALWKRCGGAGSQIPDRVLDEIKTKRNPNSQAIAFLAGLTGTEEQSLRPIMHRQRSSINL